MTIIYAFLIFYHIRIPGRATDLFESRNKMSKESPASEFTIKSVYCHDVCDRSVEDYTRLIIMYRIFVFLFLSHSSFLSI